MYKPDWNPDDGPEVWVFPPGQDLRAVALARHVAREAARAWGCAATAHTAMTVVGELAGNALLHTGGPAHVRMRRWRGLRVEVSDRAPEPVTPGVPDLDAEGGRGLGLVAALADRWGARSAAGARPCGPSWAWTGCWVRGDDRGRTR